MSAAGTPAAVAEDGLRPLPRVRVTYEEGRPVAPAPDARSVPAAAGRVRLLLGVLLSVFCLLTLRLAHVSFGMEEELSVLRAQSEERVRPEVVDRRGRPLIMNRTTRGLGIDGRDVWDVEETARAVGSVFPDADADRLRARLSDRAYAFVADDITDAQHARVVALGLPGMRYPEGSARVYPQGPLAPHVLGYRIPGRGGATGVERALDAARGAGEGRVRLTLDAQVQRVLEAEIAGAIETFSARAGWGVLMDARDGSVIALASLPHYDPNAPGAAPADARRNRALSDVYELGSAFKPLTVAAAMEAGLVDGRERFDVAEPIRVGDWSIKDYSPKTEPLTASEILQYSSNIGTVRIAERLGAEGFAAMLDDLGLAGPLRTDMGRHRGPLLPARWGPAELATASYGHGLAVSPVALTAAFAAVVNGGERVAPRFFEDTEPERTRVFSEETSAALRLALRRVLTDGTGRNAEARGYHAIGKTATADKPGAGGYGGEKLVSSFVGAFPGYDPAYVLLVSLDEPKGIPETYGFATAGYTAAPVFRRVVERAAPMLGVMPVGDAVAFDGFVGLRRDGEPRDLDALARLLEEAAS